MVQQQSQQQKQPFFLKERSHSLSCDPPQYLSSAQQNQVNQLVPLQQQELLPHQLVQLNQFIIQQQQQQQLQQQQQCLYQPIQTNHTIQEASMEESSYNDTYKHSFLNQQQFELLTTQKKLKTEENVSSFVNQFYFEVPDSIKTEQQEYEILLQKPHQKYSLQRIALKEQEKYSKSSNDIDSFTKKQQNQYQQQSKEQQQLQFDDKELFSEAKGVNEKDFYGTQTDRRNYQLKPTNRPSLHCAGNVNMAIVDEKEELVGYQRSKDKEIYDNQRKSNLQYEPSPPLKPEQPSSASYANDSMHNLSNSPYLYESILQQQNPFFAHSVQNNNYPNISNNQNSNEAEEKRNKLIYQSILPCQLPPTTNQNVQNSNNTNNNFQNSNLNTYNTQNKNSGGSSVLQQSVSYTVSPSRSQLVSQQNSRQNSSHHFALNNTPYCSNAFNSGSQNNNNNLLNRQNSNNNNNNTTTNHNNFNSYTSQSQSNHLNNNSLNNQNVSKEHNASQGSISSQIMFPRIDMHQNFSMSIDQKEKQSNMSQNSTNTINLNNNNYKIQYFPETCQQSEDAEPSASNGQLKQQCNKILNQFHVHSPYIHYNNEENGSTTTTKRSLKQPIQSKAADQEKTAKGKPFSMSHIKAIQISSTSPLGSSDIESPTRKFSFKNNEPSSKGSDFSIKILPQQQYSNLSDITTYNYYVNNSSSKSTLQHKICDTTTHKLNSELSFQSKKSADMVSNKSGIYSISPQIIPGYVSRLNIPDKLDLNSNNNHYYQQNKGKQENTSPHQFKSLGQVKEISSDQIYIERSASDGYSYKQLLDKNQGHKNTDGNDAKSNFELSNRVYKNSLVSNIQNSSNNENKTSKNDTKNYISNTYNNNCNNNNNSNNKNQLQNIQNNVEVIIGKQINYQVNLNFKSKSPDQQRCQENAKQQQQNANTNSDKKPQNKKNKKKIFDSIQQDFTIPIPELCGREHQETTNIPMEKKQFRSNLRGGFSDRTYVLPSEVKKTLLKQQQEAQLQNQYSLTQRNRTQSYHIPQQNQQVQYAAVKQPPQQQQQSSSTKSQSGSQDIKPKQSPLLLKTIKETIQKDQLQQQQQIEQKQNDKIEHYFDNQSQEKGSKVSNVTPQVINYKTYRHIRQQQHQFQYQLHMPSQQQAVNQTVFQTLQKITGNGPISLGNITAAHMEKVSSKQQNSSTLIDSNKKKQGYSYANFLNCTTEEPSLNKTNLIKHFSQYE